MESGLTLSDARAKCWARQPRQEAETAQALQASSADQSTHLLTGIAMTGAAGTARPPEVFALGRALADGLITDDDQINIADLVLPAMADMDRPHISLLELLVRWMPESSTGNLRILPYPGEHTPAGGSPNRAWGSMRSVRQGQR